MIASRTESARHETRGHPKDRPVPRAAALRRSGVLAGIGFAALLLMLAGIPPAAAGPISPPTSRIQDADGDGVEDALGAWRDGRLTWTALRELATAAPRRLRLAKAQSPDGPVWQGPGPAPAGGAWEQGFVRILQFGGDDAARARAGKAGGLEVLHELPRLQASVLALDPAGLRAYLQAAPGGRIMLDRDGVPALDGARLLVGLPALTGDPWRLGDDWLGTLAILDSGCDTAHGDLGDYPDDDEDGPAPAVGDADDWYPAHENWPLFEGYKVVGWRDVTDDFPQAQGPWDYHHHGTALASVAVGAGRVDSARAGVVPGGRLTVVKFYDFDVTWHAWAGDYLAAVDWLVANRETFRVRAALTAVNWDVDAGIGAAMDALLDAGIVPVAAMGNHGTDPAGPGYPAVLPGVLTCGGVNDDGAVAAFSGRGLPGQGKPDLLAPAGGLLAAGGRIEVCDNEPDDTYSGRFGTSLAAAHAAGAVYLLGEAVHERGSAFPPGRDGALLRMTILAATAAPVDAAETADGTGVTALPPSVEPDEVRGGGLLRIDAAVAAVCDPLQSGLDGTDFIGAGWERPVIARRLVTSPGVRYLVEAQPQPGLDISLEICDPWGQVTGLEDVSVERDASGAGVSEFTYVRPAAGHWLSLVVKRVSGAGTVTLRLLEADTFPGLGRRATLPGTITGNLNVGDPTGAGVPLLVVPSRVTVDDAARALSLVRPDGTVPPGWPTFVFPHISAQGGLQQPLVWDLDGQPGDEIVTAAQYGTVYFFAADGSHTELEIALNLGLSRSVGVEGAGERRVVVVDETGRAWAWAHGGVLRAQEALGHVGPLAPAVGTLAPAAAEAVVVAFGDGTVFALDADLQVRSGWPRNLGETLTMPPVLVDLDEDGDHEVVLTVFDAAGGNLRMRVLEGDGAPAGGDGTLLPAPGGGTWLAASTALVTGRYGTGELGVSVIGLAASPLTLERERWSLATATLRASGSAVASQATLNIRAGTDEGQMIIEHALLSTPLAWNQTGGTGVEPALLLGLHWIERLYGVTTVPGGATGWYLAGDPSRPLAGWEPLGRGGPAEPQHGRIGTALLDPADGSLLRVQVLDADLVIHPVLAGTPGGTTWATERGDGRNSGALTLRTGISSTGATPVIGTRVRVFPNPASDRVRFQLDDPEQGVPVSVEIFDLRGRRLRRLSGPAPQLVWDGRDRSGRPLAAGAYLAVVRHGGVRQVRRIVLTR